MSEQPPPDAAFPELLRWHLEYGTRPAGRGKRWTSRTFATAVGVDEKTVNNWVNGQRTPPAERPGPRLRAGKGTRGGAGLDDICDALFGKTPAAPTLGERAALEQAHARAGGKGGALPRSPRDDDSASSRETFPPDPRMIGRDDLREQVVADILASRPVVIPGGPGMGKTTLSLAAAHDARIAERFGANRFFVPLDQARSGEDLVRRTAQAMGLAASGARDAVLAAIAGRCAPGPTLVLLDNCESPDQADRAGTREALERLSALPGLTPVVSVRGEANLLKEADGLDNLPALDPGAAQALFLREATGIKEDDPDLPELLRELDGHPLSLVLLARVAEGERRVRPVLDDWRKRHAELLREGAGDDRLTSVRVSLAVSLASPLMTEDGKRLVGLLALCPGGLRREEARNWIGGDADRTLLKLRLAEERDAQGGARLRMLAPLRWAAQTDRPATDEDFERLWKMIAQALAQSEACVLGKGGSHEAAIREADNLNATVEEACLRSIDLTAITFAGVCLSRFASLTGMSGIAALGAVRRLSQRHNDIRCEGNTVMFEAEFHLARSDHDAARRAYEEAKTLCQAVPSDLGEANCVMRLGDIALERSDHAAARQAYEEARPIYQRVDDALGEANCIWSLGDVALRRSDHAAAREAYEQARAIYQRIGSALGEATCIRSLGDIALERSDHAAAREAYEQARPIYQRVGSALGEANCIKSLGDIAAKEERPDAARGNWEAALALYARIPEPYSIGFTHLRLARVARSAAESKEHRAKARAAWLSIDRADLVAKYLGAPEDGAGA